jgi:hypothetical protein
MTIPIGVAKPGARATAAEFPVIAAVLLCIGALLWGTGLATDDYVHLMNGLTRPLAENWWPKEYVSVPLLHYTHALAYYLFGGNLWAYDLLKVAYAGIGVYFSSRFFRLYCAPHRALAFGFLFVFLPTHDGATFWLTGLYLVLSFSFYLFAFVQGAKACYGRASVLATVGSFLSYGSPPIAFGLSVLALMQRRLKHAIALLLPNLIYSAYYVFTSILQKRGTERLTGEFSLLALGKQFLLQIVTFLDAAGGPSAWAKLYYSVASLDTLSVVLGSLIAVVLTWFGAREERPVVSGRLLAAAAMLLVAAFVMFAMTGLYPQLAFNLGNRIMIYGGFFLVCLMVVLRLPRVVEIGVVLLLCLSIAGVSHHWKQWNQSVERVGSNIRALDGFRNIPAGARVYVSGHQYSRLGPYSHIEFFQANYVVSNFFALQLGSNIAFHAVSFNRRLVFEDGGLRDRKYGDFAPVGKGIWLYDSERNALEWVVSTEIPGRLWTLPDETRHWTQRLNDGWLKTRLLEAIPRLRYAY